MGSRQQTFPEAALDWLLPQTASVILALGASSAQLARRFTQRGHKLSMVDADPAALAKVRLKLPGVTLVSASPAKLPFPSCSFHAVLLTSDPQRFAEKQTLAELARVLIPGGELLVQDTLRDDSVPWVRRLAAIVQRADPTAMTATTHAEGLDAIAASPHFRNAAAKEFRLWIPADKEALLGQVRRNAGVAALDPAAREDLLGEVGALYDSSARAPEPLLLPYKISCWKAEVDHGALVTRTRRDDGFQISL
jgi:ubiquinone/menaquinone biosynthesis C-methylase UbiE